VLLERKRAARAFIEIARVTRAFPSSDSWFRHIWQPRSENRRRVFLRRFFFASSIAMHSRPGHSPPAHPTTPKALTQHG
jgi:hypothetical protein